MEFSNFPRCITRPEAYSPSIASRYAHSFHVLVVFSRHSTRPSRRYRLCSCFLVRSHSPRSVSSESSCRPERRTLPSSSKPPFSCTRDRSTTFDLTSPRLTPDSGPQSPCTPSRQPTRSVPYSPSCTSACTEHKHAHVRLGARGFSLRPPLRECVCAQSPTDTARSRHETNDYGSAGVHGLFVHVTRLRRSGANPLKI